MSALERESLSDGQLMSRLADGETEMLGVLYSRYVSMVFSALRKFAPEIPDAKVEELGQDVFLVLLDSAPRYREQMKFKAWLFGISVRTARNWRRNTWLRRRLLKERGDGGVGMALKQETSPAALLEARQEVTIALEKLSTSQREIFLLHAEGFSGEEIGNMLSVKTKTVWTRLHRARRLLLSTLGAEAKEVLVAGGQP